jgi:hypothetical protein
VHVCVTANGDPLSQRASPRLASPRLEDEQRWAGAFSKGFFSPRLSAASQPQVSTIHGSSGLSKRVPTTIPAYDPRRLDKILRLLGRASDDPLDVALARLRNIQDELERDSLSLVYAVGLAHDGSEASLIWDELERDSPSHRQLAAWVLKMAKAARPLDPTVCRPELRSSLDATIRTRWAPCWKRERRNAEPSLRTLDWAGFP